MPQTNQIESLIFGAFAVMFGLAMGSFVNVVAHRLPEGGFRSLSGRSHCPHCGSRIRWFDNFPVLSWLALRRRCRDCGKGISARYPTVELFSGLLFLIAWWSSTADRDPLDRGFSLSLVATWAFLSVLLALSIIDLRLRILPDELTIPTMVAGPIVAALAPQFLLETWSSGLLAPVITHENVRATCVSILGIVVGAGVIAAIRTVGTRFFSHTDEFTFSNASHQSDRLDAFLAQQTPRHSKREVKGWIDEGCVELLRSAALKPELTCYPAMRLHEGDRVRVSHVREAMGFGDVKLQGAIGAFVGPESSLLVLALASLGGAVLGSLNIFRIFAILNQRASSRRRGHRENLWRVARIAGGTVPFGPFLAGGAAVLLLARGRLLAILQDSMAYPR